MAEICGNCVNLCYNEPSSYSSTPKYRCKEGHGYKEPTDRACSYDYCFNPNSKNSEPSGYQQSGCYITTIICKILGYDDNCEMLTILRQFRENVLKCNINYIPLLQQYDITGPMISYEINNLEDKYEFAEMIKDNFLDPCISAIKEGYAEEAVRIYENMVEMLCETFYITIAKPKKNTPFDFQNIGHGRMRVLPQSA